MQLSELQNELGSWVRLAERGMIEAIGGLAGLLGIEFTMRQGQSHVMAIDDVPLLFGGPETLVTAVYLTIIGEAEGHIILIYEPQVAFKLVDIAMGEPHGTTTDLGEMGESVLGEIGNVMGAHFLRTLSDDAGLDVQVSPPVVVTDMVGSVLDGALADLMIQDDHAVIVDMGFGTTTEDVSGRFIVLPNQEIINQLKRASGQ
jgi:chemotaxis protein CheC